jgi:hypothetical protein
MAVLVMALIAIIVLLYIGISRYKFGCCPSLWPEEGFWSVAKTCVTLSAGLTCLFVFAMCLYFTWVGDYPTWVKNTPLFKLIGCFSQSNPETSHCEPTVPLLLCLAGIGYIRDGIRELKLKYEELFSIN